MTETTNEAAAILTTAELRKRIEASAGIRLNDLPGPIRAVVVAACVDANVVSGAEARTSWLYRNIIEATEVG